MAKSQSFRSWLRFAEFTENFTMKTRFIDTPLKQWFGPREGSDIVEWASGLKLSWFWMKAPQVVQSFGEHLPFRTVTPGKWKQFQLRIELTIGPWMPRVMWSASLVIPDSIQGHLAQVISGLGQDARMRSGTFPDDECIKGTTCQQMSYPDQILHNIHGWLSRSKHNLHKGKDSGALDKTHHG